MRPSGYDVGLPGIRLFVGVCNYIRGLGRPTRHKAVGRDMQLLKRVGQKVMKS